MFIEQHRGNAIKHFIMHRISFPRDVIVFDHIKRFSSIFSSRSISSKSSSSIVLLNLYVLSFCLLSRICVNNDLKRINQSASCLRQSQAGAVALNQLR